MIANPRNNNTRKYTKAVGAILGVLLVLAPGAAAVGALDVGGSLKAAAEVTGRVDGDTSFDAKSHVDGATEVVNELVAEAEGAADAAIRSAESVHVKAEVRADATPVVQGATQAGTGFGATARGYFESLLNGFLGFIGYTKTDAEIKTKHSIETSYDIQQKAQYDAEMKVNETLGTAKNLSKEVRATIRDGIEASSALKSQGEAKVYAGAGYAQSFKAPDLPQPPSPPRVSVSLTASLQAAIAGILTLF